MRAESRIALTGLRMRLPIASRSSSVSLGICSGSHGGDSPGGGASGSGDVSISSISWPDPPSMVAWWYLVSSAQRPLSNPSMT